MYPRRRFPQLLAVAAAALVGCHAPAKQAPIPYLELPRELDKVTFPTYTIETPDILLIDAVRVIPLPPYKVQPLDALYLYAPGSVVDDKGANPDAIQGIYPVDTDGTINLGLYGLFPVVDKTIDQIQKELATKLKDQLADPTVNVSLAASRGSQQITGQHIVRPDGTVGLGVYGSVYVAGMTLAQAKGAVEQHLSKYLYRPEVSMDVFSFNSKWYYVITDFAGAGEQVVRIPATGNETVLDAVSQIGGLSAVSSKKLWVARPAPPGCPDQILPVDWKAITRRGHSGTNYQMLPGDRLFVMSQPLTKLDTYFGRIVTPLERALGYGLFGYTVFDTFGGGGSLFGGGNN